MSMTIETRGYERGVVTLVRIILSCAPAVLPAAIGCGDNDEIVGDETSTTTRDGGATNGGATSGGATGQGASGAPSSSGGAGGGSSSGSGSSAGSSSGGAAAGGASSGGAGGSADCDCVIGAYRPMCGVDGTTYDAACGLECVPVEIACAGQCPCAGGPDGGSGQTCGGVSCAPGEACCGPPECGYCIPIGTDPACAGACTSTPCGDQGLECYDPIFSYPGEACVEVDVVFGPQQTITWHCVRNPCGLAPLDCSCAGDLCTELDPITNCVAANPEPPTLRCTGGGPCASPDTPIATPSGDRPIASLAPGDLVYSAHRDALDVVPVLRVGRTPVSGHEVVRVTLETGRVLEISARHPTADGRTFADLRVGDELGGALVVGREVVPYAHTHTYDVLPDSDTGTYLAGGVLIGSSMVR